MGGAWIRVNKKNPTFNFNFLTSYFFSIADGCIKNAPFYLLDAASILQDVKKIATSGPV